MHIKGPSYRRYHLLGFALCLAAFIYALIYLQDPTTHLSNPLISLSKLIILGCALLFFSALLHNPRTFGQQFYGCMLFILSAGGIILSGYRFWKHVILSTPNPPLFCQQSIEQLLNKQHVLGGKPIELLNTAIQCPAEPIRFMGLGEVEQCFIIFSVLQLISYKILIQRPKDKGFFL